jgi:hypothetical protein
MYSDVPWLPYQGTNISVTEFGFSAGQTGIHNFVHEHLKNLSASDIKYRIAYAERVREHYTLSGVIKQVEKLITDPFGPTGGELRCTRLPLTDH